MYFISMMEAGPQRDLARQKLDAVTRYGDLRTCRRSYLLSYFGEQTATGSCEGCDVCLGTVAQPDAPQKKATFVKSSPDTALFEHLRALRKRLAYAQHVPPYMIFGDVSLKQMAALKPKNREAFASISGVGQKKLEMFGETFMDAIRNYAG